MARLSTRTKKKIAHKSREILENEPQHEIFGNQLIYKLDKHGLKGTLIYPETLNLIIKQYAPDIIEEHRRVCNGLRHTKVTVYKLK